MMQVRRIGDLIVSPVIQDRLKLYNLAQCDIYLHNQVNCRCPVEVYLDDEYDPTELYLQLCPVRCRPADGPRELIFRITELAR